MRHILLAAAAMIASTSIAGVPTPPRPVTAGRDIVSPTGSPRPISAERIVISARSVNSIAWSADDQQIFLISDLAGFPNIWKMNAKGGWPQPLTRVDQRQSGLVALPDGKTLLFTQDTGGDENYDIYSISTDGSGLINLTATPQVAEKLIVPSPDGSRIAFTYKVDKKSQRDVAVMDLRTRAVRNLTNEADPRGIWSAVAWSKDSRALIANREDTLLGGDAGVWSIDVATAARTPLIEQRKGGRDLASGLSPDGGALIVTSDFDYPQLRVGLYDIGAKRYRWIPGSPWEQRSVRDADAPVMQMAPDGKSFLVVTNQNGKALISIVDVATLTARPIALGVGSNAPLGLMPFSHRSDRFAFTHSAGDAPPDLRVGEVASGSDAIVAKFAFADMSADNLPRSQTITYESFDGTLIDAILTMPFNLARDGSNPAVVMPHGGPTWQSWDDFQGRAAYLASHGYIVLQPNYRGSTGYGKTFQEAERHDMGNGDLKDVVAGKAFLVSTGYVDPKRVGITGQSAGGWLTMLALGKIPDAFAAGVQVYGVVDWITFLQHTDGVLYSYVEGLFGDPVKEKDAYVSAGPITYLNEINAPLLSLQGDRDIRVPPQQAVQVDAALKARGVISQMVMYRDEGHGFRKPENQIDELKRMTDWFDLHLKSPTSRTR